MNNQTDEQSTQLSEITLQYSSVLTTKNRYEFRDLNHNGLLDIYEDPRRPVEERVDDLLGQMTLEEKAGLMFINGAHVNADGSLDDKPGASGLGLVARDAIANKAMNHFNFWQIPGPLVLASWHNNLQTFAETSRLGIPITIASDPRNHISETIFAMAAVDFSQWCETLGFGAIGDPDLVRKFGEIVREEYLAVGIRVALHPQIDLATEPRWPRIFGCFSEDAHLTAAMGKAYIQGFQGEQLGPQSVACMTKHFPGGGPQKEGLDPHFDIQRGQFYPGDNFEYHLIPFEAALEAGTASIMPYYGVPTGQTNEDVAMSFNKDIITGLLRERYGYDGVVCTDWGLITDKQVMGAIWPACAWGVEHLSELDRVAKVLEAGVDQFGGENCPDLVVELVRDGRISEERINVSVRRLLRQKFQLGLFDNPFVDEKQVLQVLGKPESLAAGEDSQRRAMTLLKNDGGILPVHGEPKLYIKNINADIAAGYADLVETPGEADLAIIRLQTPWYPVEGNNPMVQGFHHGDLDFKGEAKAEIMRLLDAVPTIVVLYLDRPAVIPEINDRSVALLGEYGASDQAVLDVVFGKANPEGKLPFELPSSMEAVRKQRSDVPHDSENPIYNFGYGLSYEKGEPSL